MSRLLPLLLATILTSLSPFYAEKLPPKAEILIVTDAANVEEARSLLRTFTYLKRTAAVATPDAASLVLGQYCAIVCLDPMEAPDGFLERLASTKTPLFFIGSSTAHRYLGRLGMLQQAVTGAASWEYHTEGFPVQTGVAALTDAPVMEAPTYQSGSLSVAGLTLPLVFGVGSTRMLPLPFSTSLLPTLTRELSLWLWPYADAPPDYGTYLTLTDIYPFTDPHKLLAAIDLCIDANIPFALIVHPFYQNGDYPAMRRFCELLAYAQANGGSVLLQAPSWQGDAPPLSTLNEEFTKALMLYTANGVYPLGVAVPAYWQEDERLREALARFRTVLLLEDPPDEPSLTENRNAILDAGHRLIVEAPSDSGAFATYPTALCLPLDTLADDALAKEIAAVKTSGIPLGNLWNVDHAVYANNLELLYDGAVLSLNGERQKLTYTPAPIEESYDYKRGMLTRVTMSLAGGSKFALWLTVCSLAVFLVLMLIGRRQGKESFFHRKGPDDDTP